MGMVFSYCLKWVDLCAVNCRNSQGIEKTLKSSSPCGWTLLFFHLKTEGDKVLAARASRLYNDLPEDIRLMGSVISFKFLEPYFSWTTSLIFIQHFNSPRGTLSVSLFVLFELWILFCFSSKPPNFTSFVKHLLTRKCLVKGYCYYEL